MNIAHLHLVLNHAPLFGLIFGFCLHMYSLRQRDETVHRLALYTFIITAFLSFPAYITGEQTEHIIEHLKGVNTNAILQHENSAKIANLFSLITGITALGWFYAKKKNIKRNISLALLGLSLLGIAFMSRTANLGGQIRHPEIGEAITDNK